MSWTMQVHTCFGWADVESDGKPYRYTTKDEADRALNKWYPEQCRSIRLGGDAVVRVAECDGEPNMSEP